MLSPVRKDLFYYYVLWLLNSNYRIHIRAYPGGKPGSSLPQLQKLFNIEGSSMYEY